MELEQVKHTGLIAARKSADVLLSHFGKISSIKKKGAIDLVTIADTESEKTIINTIREKFPYHTILAEESGRSNERSDCKWIIDPLDGTTNYAHGLGVFAVSIAFAYKDEIQMGIVFNPTSNELFWAVKEQGAFLNDVPIKTSATKSLSESLLVTGFPYNFKEIFSPLMSRFKNCLNEAQGIRRLGSAALDLCFVACGRFDGFWEQNLNPWDTAAGTLIVEESGGKITDFSNNTFNVDMNEILATNGNIHEQLIALLEI